MPRDEDPNLEPEEFVDKLVGDPATAGPEVLVLTGWVGRSTRDGHVRLYLTPDLVEYVSIPTEDVLHTEKVPAERAGLAATRVWLRATAEIQHTQRMPGSAARHFLGGPAASTFLSRFGRFRGGGRFFGGGNVGLASVPPQASVCFSCPTEGGEDTCVPATCTLSTSCQTQYLCT
jgi:hypothetical protein